MAGALSGLTEALRAAVELALPVSCAGCGAPGTGWCSACRDDSGFERGSSGRPEGGESSAGRPRQRAVEPDQVSMIGRPSGFPATWSGAPYSGAVRSAVVAYKDQGRADLRDVLRDLLAPAAQAALDAMSTEGGPRTDHRVVVVPVPSSGRSRRRRGADPIRILAAATVRLPPEVAACRGLRGPVSALRFCASVRDQSELTRPQRLDNVRSAIEVRPRHVADVVGAGCLLVDDVVTTGATLAAAAQALRAVGARCVHAATVAVVDR